MSTLDAIARRSGVPLKELREWDAAGLLDHGGRPADVARDTERVRLIRLFVRRGIDLDAIREWIREGEMERHLDLLVTSGDGASYTLAEASALLDVDADLLGRIWEAAGFGVETLDGADVEALRALRVALDAGFSEDAVLQLVRVFADAMHRVADVEARLFHFHIRNALLDRGLGTDDLSAAVWRAGELVNRLDQPTLLYLHRKALRHAIAETHVLELAQQAGLAEPPDATGQIEVAIAFVDLSSFTPLAESKGDVEAAQVLDRFAAVVRQAVARLDGHVVKQIGDAFMLAFPQVSVAVRAALEIERRAADEPQFPAVRCGIHWGRALYREGDYVGASVNLAARVADAAERHQVFVTGAARRAAGRLDGVEFVPLATRRLKGVADPIELFMVRPADRGAAPLAIDPTCGLELAPGEIAARLAIGGLEHAFCSEECLRRFLGRAA